MELGPKSTFPAGPEPPAADKGHSSFVPCVVDMTTVRRVALTSHRSPPGRPRSRGCAEDGFSLVEALMASFIVVLLFAGFGRSMGTAYLGSKENAATQEATALGVERVEFARSLDWAHIAMSGVAEDAPLIDPVEQTLVAADTALETNEPLVVDSADGMVEPVGTETVDGVAYTVWSYVSEDPNGLRRVLVLIQWAANGSTSTHRTSTLISEASTR